VAAASNFLLIDSFVLKGRSMGW